ncbi:baseplate J/gp47 family protein [Bradyrhizobium sp. BRP23]|uniref:baseplate J/gp47 family protein n=1 Tax=Bradyrhizobium sp. BRP23 TaxID=2793820 RepID=UPI001CD33876|nr:baseplate J/gp47 family protein [Bradyrhizobium sp. BRP23]MCA1419499.1 baseplate J/gp47 family protein [Bradyrhizobium sp. BRP23]
MPWTTPSLKDVRRLVRDYVLSRVGGVALIPNSALRIMSDAQAGLTHLTLIYLDWLAKQLMPDTAEREWLDRFGVIWLTNADGSKGRQAATFASGSVTFSGNAGVVIPQFSELIGANQITYETQDEITIGTIPTEVAVKATIAGLDGNLDTGEAISLTLPIGGADTRATVVTMEGGVDEESDDSLRERILFRIQNPPMGGSQADYVRWARAVPGVTRAWAYPEMGPGTMTVRFLMDELRGDNHGLPEPNDIAAVQAYLDVMRPVTVKDMWVSGPVPLFYTIAISDLVNDDGSTQEKILQSIQKMEFQRSAPGQTMYRSWVDEAISNAVGEDHHELAFDTLVPSELGYMPMIDTINYS